jgi:hypothetical protein
MADESTRDTLPPPPFEPSADAVYIVDTLLSKMSEMRGSINKELGKIHKILDEAEQDDKAFSERVLGLVTDLKKKQDQSEKVFREHIAEYHANGESHR